jgi:hypothetical protein
MKSEIVDLSAMRSFFKGGVEIYIVCLIGSNM